MYEDLHNIEELFKSSLDDNKEMPSAKVWNSIDHRLDKHAAALIKKKYNTLKKLSLFLLLLLISLGIYELNTLHIDNHLTKTKYAIADKTVHSENYDKANESVRKSISKGQPGSKDVKSYKSLIADKPNVRTLPSGIKGIATSKQHDLFVNPPESTQKISGIESGANRQTMAKNSDVSFVGPLDNLPVEKMTGKIISADLKKPLQPLVSAKSNSVIDTKKPVVWDAKNKETKAPHFSLTTFFSPDRASYSLKDNDISNQTDNAAQIKKNERHEFSSTSGLLINYSLKKRWALQSGLTFSNTNIAVEQKTIYAQADINGDLKYRLNISSGYGYLIPSFQPAPAIGDSLKVTAITHKLRYIGIPLAVKYSILKGRIKMEILTGVATNFLIMGKVETETQQGPNNEVDILNKIQGLKSLYFSGLAGIGAEYEMTDKLSFILIPTARFALNSINKHGVVKTYPNSVGLASGIRLRF